MNNKELLDIVEKLYKLEEWKNIFPPSVIDWTKYPANKTLYEEYIFRALAFSNSHKTYSGNMQLFLDSFMRTYKLNDEEKEKHFNIMKKTVSFLSENAGYATDFFKPNKKFNPALFDAIFAGLYNAFSNNNSINKEKFKKYYNQFLAEKLYGTQGNRSIVVKLDVINRISKSIEIFLGED